MNEVLIGRIIIWVLVIVTIIFLITKVGGVALIVLLVVDVIAMVGIPVRRYWLQTTRDRPGADG
jgi:hypothetical protein